MTITPEQHEIHLRQLAYFERKADELRKLTQQYLYDIEAQRVVDKKQDSAKYYEQLNKLNNE